MKRIQHYLKRIYRLLLPYNKYELIVWKDLKKLHQSAGWKSGFFENERYIETTFEIAKEQLSTYYYMIYDGAFHCRVKVLEGFSAEYATDLFILASHFNNILNHGVVAVNVQNQCVEYHTKKDIIVPLLYTGEIYQMLIQHHKASKDVYKAFQRLMIENEAPAIIIADLLKEHRGHNRDTSQ